MKNLNARVAVITGAGSGIGRAISILLAEEGCHLAIADINQEGLMETLRQIEKPGRKISTHLLDVSNLKDMTAFCNDVLKIHGDVHLLINNAGVAVNDLVVDGLIEDFEWIMGINFWGVVYGCKLFLPQMLKTDRAHIVNISSIFGLAGIPSQATYCSTKFAVRGFTESLRSELMDTHVSVSCVHPGGVATNIEKKARFRKSFDGSTHEELTRTVEKLAFNSPEQAAQIILKGIKANKEKIVIGSDAYFVDIITRLFPVFYSRILRVIFKPLRPNSRK